MYRFNRELMLDIRKFKISRLLMLLTLSLVGGIANASEKIEEDPVELRIQEIMKDLTLEQKVGQMVQGEIKWVTPSDVTKYHLGSILNGGGSFPNKNKNSTMQDWLSLADDYYLASQDTSGGGAGIPIVWGTDAVHGHNNVVGATLFPHNIGLGAANDSDLMKKIGEITAREVAVTGIDWVFAPTVAVAKDNRWGRTYEAYSSQSPIIKSYAGEIVAGLQGPLAELSTNESKVIATAKHFIGDGGTLRGVDQGDTIMSLQELLDEHGQGYYEALDAEVQTVMATFNSWNGVKIHGHKFLLTDVLKNQMGFDGFVVSDWNGIGQVEGCTNNSCAQAINAGIDMVMVPEQWKGFLRNTLKQVKAGEISMARIDDAVERILRVKIRAGLFEKGLPSSREVAGNADLIGAPAHREVARDAVRKSLVLLKNDDVLPLRAGQHVLVAGDGADNIGKQNGGWTITWQGTENKNSEFPGATSIYNGLANAMNSIGGSTELSVSGNWSKKPDVAVVVFGEEPYAEGQGDVHTLAYRNGRIEDLELMQKLQSQDIPVVSVFITGRPLWVNAEINSSEAFVVAWLPGTEGGGVADVLVADSDNNPRYDFTGRLSFDWPNKDINSQDEALPVFDNLLQLGQGLSYGDETILSDSLSEVSAAAPSSEANIIFSGSSQEPWLAYVGDASDWHRQISGTQGSSPQGGLSVVTVDGLVQEDSRKLTWTGGHESQFYWQAASPADLTDLKSKNGALMMEFKVDQHPMGVVTQRMDCGWPCSGAIDMTEFFKSVPEGQLSRIGISLQCFDKLGVDLSKVTSPMVLVSEEPFVLTIRDVRIVPDASQESMISCS
ncbi:MAG: glycoside hydrolase family 3 N-terminal domain-containing protein [Porticoccaceae bacterium]|nr:glycoside hydrolase family 3 N-terminal domain-containing protein [Porticoccaceae bacterium]